jgi:hypothetical protein
LSSAISVTDPDDLDLSSAVVSIVGGNLGTHQDVLAAITTGTNIVASYSTSFESLSLTGVDTVAHYQQVLESITFNTGENPTAYGSNPTRVIKWQLFDPSGNANGASFFGTPVTTTVSVTNVNAPRVWV